jgi:uncharacterized membrane protein
MLLAVVPGVCWWYFWYLVWVDVVFGVIGTAVAAAGEEVILEEDPVMTNPVQEESQLHLVILHLNTVAAHLSIMHHRHTQR